MGSAPDKKMIVGLDIGTSKVSVVVGEITEDDNIEVIGIGIHPSRGLKKGVVVNIYRFQESVREMPESVTGMSPVASHVIPGIFAVSSDDYGPYGRTPKNGDRFLISVVKPVADAFLNYPFKTLQDEHLNVIARYSDGEFLDYIM